jgi:hypothetical protein
MDTYAFDTGAEHQYPDEAMVPQRRGDTLADVLERVLDKGIVVAGDIQVDLLAIELLTIKLRLLIASVERAKEMGIDWWEADPMLSTKARAETEDRSLEERLRRLERAVAGGELPNGSDRAGDHQDSPGTANESGGSRVTEQDRLTPPNERR